MEQVQQVEYYSLAGLLLWDCCMYLFVLSVITVTN